MSLKIKEHKVFIIFFLLVIIIAAAALIVFKVDVKLVLESTYLSVESGKVVLEKLI